MTMTSLGSGFAPRRSMSDLEPILASIADGIATAVRAEYADQMNELRAQVKELLARRVDPPQVNVAPAAPAQVTVTASAIPPDVVVNNDNKDMVAALSKVYAELVVANKPLVRTVERDAEGLITRITERRI